MVAGLHVREGNVDQRLERGHGIAGLARYRAAQDAAQFGRIAAADRRPVRSVFVMLDDTIDDPVAEAAHVGGGHAERVGALVSHNPHPSRARPAPPVAWAIISNARKLL